MIEQDSQTKPPSTALFSEQAREFRLKLAIKVIILMVALLLIINLFISGVSSLFFAEVSAIVVLFLLYFWLTPDTSNLVAGMVLWLLAVLLSYACWLGLGIHDSLVFAFPCLLMLAIVLSSKVVFISLFSYVLGVLFFFTFAQNHHLLPHADLMANTPWWSRIFTYIVVLLFFTGGMLYIFFDIKKMFKSLIQENTTLESSIAQLRKRSRYDQLTLLPNEHVCKYDIENALKNQKTSGNIIAFITLNISNIRNIITNYSHDVTDETILQLVKRLQQLSHDSLSIYHFQQSEFVLVKHSKDYRGISRIAEQIFQASSQLFQLTEYEVTLQPEIGIALAPFDGKTMEALRHNSHLAMYTEQKEHRQDFNFFDKEMAKQEQRKLLLTKALKSAIDNDEFILHFQPKIDLESKEIIGAESLIRWVSPEYGFISPEVFIPLAEQTGVITDITYWVIEHSIVACKAWHKQGYKRLSVAVNLSAEDFKRGNLTSHVFKSLHQTKLAAHFLELELTESIFMDDVSHIQRQMYELRTQGVSFAIDDFGTGYSNLGYLTKFNVSTLKLDRSFVANICQSTNELQIVKAILEMSKSLSISNVAEGVEDKATAAALAELGCQVGQGYYWSKPLSQEDFLALLAQSN